MTEPIRIADLILELCEQLGVRPTTAQDTYLRRRLTSLVEPGRVLVSHPDVPQCRADRSHIDNPGWVPYFDRIPIMEGLIDL